MVVLAGLMFPKMPVLESERLIIRPLEAGDEDFLARLDSNAAVMEHIHTGALSPSDAMKFATMQVEAAAFRRRFGKWMAVIRDTGERAGWVELGKLGGPKRDDVQAGYEFAPAHWRRGYATEALRCVMRYAFDELGLDRLAAIARNENAASVRVLRKCGFLLNGRRRDDGSVWCGLYFVTQDEWSAKNSIAADSREPAAP